MSARKKTSKKSSADHSPSRGNKSRKAGKAPQGSNRKGDGSPKKGAAKKKPAGKAPHKDRAKKKASPKPSAPLPQESGWAGKLLDVLHRKGAEPRTAEELAADLSVPKKERGDFLEEARRLEREGKVARIKRDRLVVPQEADLVAGTILFRQSGRAFLIPDRVPGEEEPPRVEIRAEDTGVALHKDRVLIRLMRDQRLFYKLRAQGKGNEHEAVTGRVLRILERARTTLPGTLQKSRSAWFVIPDDPRIVVDILVPPPNESSLKPKPKEDDKVIVRLHPWEQRHLNPEGEIVERLGKTHTPTAEHKAILHQYDLDPEFPPEVEEEVAAVPSHVTAAQRKGRLDIREVFTLTIDPDDAKDFDDALSLEQLEGGDLRIGVHIADVSSYVRPGSQLDKEAQKRGNSTYLVGQVIPMLPHPLSSGICSLKEAEDRLTKSVFLTFTERGKHTETRFANTVIRSRKRLTYQQAHALMTEDDLDTVKAMPAPPDHQTGFSGRPLAEVPFRELREIQKALRKLWKIAEKIRRDRFKAGSLELDMPETKIYVDEQGYADRIVKVEYDESHQLIEEFMLAANEAVGRAFNRARTAAIHRVHDEPDEDKLQELREYLATVGIEVGDLTKKSEVTKLLARVKKHPQSHTLKVAFLRSLKQACYRAEPDGHYGLHKKDYVHFTSPIRRYADLVCHRVFNRHLQKMGEETALPDNSEALKPGRLASIAEHISLTEQNSTEAERESRKVKLIEFFERQLASPKREVFRAAITDIKNHGMFVELIETGTWGLVHISTLRDDFYSVNGDSTELTGRRTGKRFTTGQIIDVVVERIDRFKRQIDFAVAASSS